MTDAPKVALRFSGRRRIRIFARYCYCTEVRRGCMAVISSRLFVVTGMLPAKTTHGLSANLHDGRHACRRQRIGCGDGRSLSVQTGRVCGFYLFCAADACHCCTLKAWLMCLEPVFPFAGIGYEGYVHTICPRHLFFDDLLYSLFFV